MNEVTQLNLRVSAGMARVTRTLAAARDKSVPEFVEDLLRFYLDPKEDPQAEKQRRKDVELVRMLAKGQKTPFEQAEGIRCN